MGHGHHGATSHDPHPMEAQMPQTKPTTPLAHPDPLLDVLQICEELGLSRPTVYRLIHAVDGIPFQHIGGKIKVRRSRLDSWIDAHPLHNELRKGA